MGLSTHHPIRHDSQILHLGIRHLLTCVTCMRLACSFISFSHAILALCTSRSCPCSVSSHGSVNIPCLFLTMCIVLPSGLHSTHASSFITRVLPSASKYDAGIRDMGEVSDITPSIVTDPTFITPPSVSIFFPTRTL